MNFNMDAATVGRDHKHVWLQARIVLGCKLDRDHARRVQQMNSDGKLSVEHPDVCDENLGIFESELCFMNRLTTQARFLRKRGADAGFREAQLPAVISSFNGVDMSFLTTGTAAASKGQPGYVPDGGWEFVGVANDSEKFSATMVRTKTGVAVQCGGTVTIKNTGSDAIMVGDLLVYTLPSKVMNEKRAHIDGTNRSKALPIVTPWCKFEEAFLRDKNNYSADEVKDLLHLYRNRIFARALECAQPGQEVGVQLGRGLYL